VASWGEIEAEQPRFAAAVRERLEAGKHKTIATLRADGSPRISGTEADLIGGELWFGSMWGARKARDLQRDPRFALHGASEDPPGWSGDAKLSGRAEEVTDEGRIEAFRRAQAERAGDEAARDDGAAAEGEEVEAPDDPSEQPARFHLFRAEIAEVVLVSLNETRDALVIEHWAEGRGLRRIERR